MKSDITIDNALQLLNNNKLAQGQELIEQLLTQDPANINAHKLMVKIGFTDHNLALAEKHLIALLTLQPLSERFFSALTDLYQHQSRWQALSALYLDLFKRQPNNATAAFNCAYYAKLSGNFDQAINYYQKALALGIDDDFEVSLNLATIYSEHMSAPTKAIKILTEAIEKHPSVDSLLYNLANLYEQLGDKEKANHYFKLACKANPNNFTALARQADIYRVNSKNDPLISLLITAFNKKNIANSDRINLGYALGKVHDDCGEYQQAFDYYQQANMLDKQTLPKYNPDQVERQINKIITTFDKSWFERFNTITTDHVENVPVFICGMFRSGSTLCEQILSAHTGISIGGEQEFFHRLVVNNYPEFPLNVSENFKKNRDEILAQYLNEINHFRTKGDQLTDKRPDNFLYLGLIKTLMPKAKIIWTKRSMLDNCLSVYFLRLGASMPYSTEFSNIVHFYQQQEKLMAHWQSLFPEDIFMFNYDELVEQPEECTRQLLSFVELPWEDKCINFHLADNQIKTASVWQVRQPLYKRSSGRWKNYQEQLAPFIS
ncbi:tetratricopeptide repeat-containing sulfotransferase family protein [Thalassotalea piscium]|uniref:Tetratricopeptide (TPR) repeat protein n=1 Tax=Thalassotalea piscium TaxID=1230533 RepID=A0A7X0NJB2_9GAMM|nr:sulfotransferase [Thalassotalea piscium]MBB6544465.1 tetratricopeptide (TPR) repeat protein [Thalassotalea piscium]